MILKLPKAMLTANYDVITVQNTAKIQKKMTKLLKSMCELQSMAYNCIETAKYIVKTKFKVKLCQKKTFQNIFTKMKIMLEQLHKLMINDQIQCQNYWK